MKGAKRNFAFGIKYLLTLVLGIVLFTGYASAELISVHVYEGKRGHVRHSREHSSYLHEGDSYHSRHYKHGRSRREARHWEKKSFRIRRKIAKHRRYRQKHEHHNYTHHYRPNPYVMERESRHRHYYNY